MIAWCGSRADGLGWLSHRCGSMDELKVVETISIDAVAAICRQHPRRLILSVENRLSYPSAEIEYLQRSWPEVPYALALSSWFDGSRRTGIGPTGRLQLAWYRWWDGWRTWLRGRNTQILNPWPQIVLSRECVALEGAKSTAPFGIILSHCRQTAAGWQAGLEGSQDSAQVITLKELLAFLEIAPIEPGWVLWDDSCLDTSSGVDCLADVCDLFAAIRKSFPTSVILAATSMPRWSDWQKWSEAGANELIAKPSQGILLQEILSAGN